MKSNISNKIITAGFLLALAFLSLACQKQTAEKSNTPTEKGGVPTEIIKAQSPTEAYKMLYAAVKAKDINKIKQLMTKNTMSFAEYQAQLQKKTVDSILENGFMATTFAPFLPEIRDERIKDNFGAVEVYNQQENHWEDLPFIFEDGGWKLAVGDVFKNTYKKPRKGQSEIENESSNTKILISPNANGKFPSSSNSNKVIEMPPPNQPK
ncbi:hypothetical protein BH24ACI2_BH24ACI2_03960 [soil metagenome]|jgi:hypothetical protein|nr:hypothetical protein [Acidobacteriota bacterium]